MLSLWVVANNGLQQTEEAPDDDSLYVALVTCDPGADAYKLFGHTGIRVRNLHEPEMDFVFNYGLFRMSQGNFIYRFVKGETDYELGPEPTEYFFGRYSAEGIRTVEQTLALTPTEKLRLWYLLVENYKPENRIYRYNFLYDNCTTRANDVIQRALLEDVLTWSEQTPNNPEWTFREILHEFTATSPWTEFGIDMVLGAEVDCPRSRKEQMFIPSILMAEMKQAQLRSGQQVRPMVSNETEYLPEGEWQAIPDFPLSPECLFGIVLILAVCLSIADICWRRTALSLSFDLVLISLQVTAGLIISFLFFFSEHPAVGSNWLVLAFNPLAWFLMPDIIRMHHKHRPLLAVQLGRTRVDMFEVVNLAVLAFTAMLFWLPLQWIGLAQLMLVFSLLLRSAVRLKTGIRQMN